MPRKNIYLLAVISIFVSSFYCSYAQTCEPINIPKNYYVTIDFLDGNKYKLKILKEISRSTIGEPVVFEYRQHLVTIRPIKANDKIKTSYSFLTIHCEPTTNNNFVSFEIPVVNESKNKELFSLESLECQGVVGENNKISGNCTLTTLFPPFPFVDVVERPLLSSIETSKTLPFNAIPINKKN